ncbi:type II secretion system GspH family protein [Duganella violaceipulchra]|uniref:Type II secretion system protein n=1 Tax=Duganella violaceipulchra TaxID=2849652 RepID=A0AA41H8D6_9BURK|nr:type II secretion system GspH family protein [Duganella violaceicalia]MBV6323973.1 type II secretion system protein [Duganella violaceicalia]MCP2011045.1 type II secretory pathway pseudopilin PulG [Duganella violaceicalia]
MRPTKQLRRTGGWTYLCLLMVVAMIGLGLTAVVEMDATMTRREKEAELLAIGHQFREAIRRYRQVPGMEQAYPAALENLLTDNRTSPPTRHLRKIFVDPMTVKAEWGLVIANGGIVGVHSLSQMTPIKQDGFDIDDASFYGQQSYMRWIFGEVGPTPRGARPVSRLADAILK